MGRKEFNSVLNSQFWGQDVSSIRSPDGIARTLPGSTAPAAMTQPSGVSRSQQLLLLQKMADVPVAPSFCDALGGVVLDRAVASLGGKNWWATCMGRVKAQRVLSQGSKNIGKEILNPANYQLSTKGRLGLGRLGTVSATAELVSLKGLGPKWKRQRGRKRAVPVPEPSGMPLPRLRLNWRKQLPFHEIVGEATVLERCLDNSVYYNVPRMATLDLKSKGERLGLFRYRVGLQGVTKVSGRNMGSLSLDDSTPHALKDLSQPHPLVDTPCAKGAVTMEKTFTLLKAGGSATSVLSDTLQDLQNMKSRALGKEVANGGKKKKKRSKNKGRQVTGAARVSRKPYSALLSNSRLSVGFLAGVSAKMALKGRGVGIPLLRPSSSQNLMGPGGSNGSGPRPTPRNSVSGEGAHPVTDDDDAWVPGGEGSAVPAGMAGMRGGAGHHGLTSPRMMLRNSGTLIRSTSRVLTSGAIEGVQHSTKRVFGAAVINMHIGGFSKPVLDSTLLSARLDLERTLGNSLNQDLGSAMVRVEEPNRPQLTLSFAQQILGPLRFTCDTRLVLERQEGGARWLQEKMASRGWLHERWMVGGDIALPKPLEFAAELRAASRELVYGLDYALPQASGAARLVAWYSPTRQEAMAEVRLLEK